ncbi:hypothetical protein QL285_039791 [Trifolium repens]|nr:hypothetical protein QL285_039791 [Trifolium repens]
MSLSAALFPLQDLILCPMSLHLQHVTVLHDLDIKCGFLGSSFALILFFLGRSIALLMVGGRGAQIQTNPNKNRKPIQKNRKSQKNEYFLMCLDVLFVKTAGSDRILD